MRFEPHPYQAYAVDFILGHPRCMLLLEMGLGKTVIALTAIRRLIDDCEASKTLVVAPKKVAEATWSAEAEKWDHLRSLRVSKVLGDVSKRRKALEAEADVYVIGRDSFVWLMRERGARLPFDCIVIDELSSFKNRAAKRFRAMRIASAGAARVIGLTGTPVPNGYVDLWAETYCVDLGERLGKSLTHYRDEYFTNVRWNNVIIKSIPKKGAVDAIREKISDIAVSMRAEDYLALPDMVVRDVPVELSPATMRGYKEFERDRVMECAEGGEVTAASAAALMNKLSQFSCGCVYDGNGDPLFIHDDKLDALEEVIEAAAGEPVLVFYQFRFDEPRIIKRLSAGGRKVRKYEGVDDLKDWNEGKIDVLLAHPASVSFGLNMQDGGHFVVWFGLGWNLEQYEQANARLHRQGQRYPVTVFRLISRGTVDEAAAAALGRKGGEQEALMLAMRKLVGEYVPGGAMRQ